MTNRVLDCTFTGRGKLTRPRGVHSPALILRTLPISPTHAWTSRTITESPAAAPRGRHIGTYSRCSLERQLSWSVSQYRRATRQFFFSSVILFRLPDLCPSPTVGRRTLFRPTKRVGQNRCVQRSPAIPETNPYITPLNSYRHQDGREGLEGGLRTCDRCRDGGGRTRGKKYKEFG